MAKIEIYKDKLTTSAEEALDEAVIEFQDLILDKANAIAQKKQTADKEISLRDIIEARDSLFKLKIGKEKLEYRKRRLTTLLYVAGALYSIIGITFYLYQNRKFDIEKDFGLIAALIGVITIFIAFIYSQLFSRLYEAKILEYSIITDDDSEYEIIKRWQIIEKIGSNLMRQKGFSTNKSKSINDILKFLSSELKSDKLYIDMRELLSIRNKILHESYKTSRQEKQNYIDKADKIIQILELQEK